MIGAIAAPDWTGSMRPEAAVPDQRQASTFCLARTPLAPALQNAAMDNEQANLGKGNSTILFLVV